MISQIGGGKMPCESCALQFSVFRRKRACSECERFYCSTCLRRGGGICSPCRALSTRPLARQAIAHLKVRDLQCFLQRQNVSTRGCVEKEELVSLCVMHVNSTAYRRRGPRAPPGPFTTLKGLTTNINEFINSAFDLRTPTQPQPPRGNSNCMNSAHAHAPPPQRARSPPAPAPAPQSRERFTTTPGGEADIRVPVPEGEVSRSASSDSARVDTADCFEIEDLDDTGWEFVNRPAEPLPNDSEVLLTTTDGVTERIDVGGSPVRMRGDGIRVGVGTPQRAASELDLHRAETTASPDSSSLQDEPLMDSAPAETAQHVTLEQMKSPEELEALNVKQLKELLARNRVEYRGCLERADLLQRARMLWHDHAKFKDEIDNLPIEECCKICMAAPLECVLLECGHIAACTQCSKQLAECPICRQYVVRAVRFFRS